MKRLLASCASLIGFVIAILLLPVIVIFSLWWREHERAALLDFENCAEYFNTEYRPNLSAKDIENLYTQVALAKGYRWN